MANIGRTVVGVVLFLALGERAAAVVPEIKDEGKFFSAQAVKKANDLIREIYLKGGRDLLIETFATVPADQVEKVKAMPAQEKSDFFRKWAAERAKRAGANGIYVLICQEPRSLRTWISPRATRAFDSKKDGRLREIIGEEFREKRFDEGLLNAVKYVRDQLLESK